MDEDDDDDGDISEANIAITDVGLVGAAGEPFTYVAMNTVNYIVTLIYSVFICSWECTPLDHSRTFPSREEAITYARNEALAQGYYLCIKRSKASKVWLKCDLGGSYTTTR